MTAELVCLGNLIVDDVVFADGTTRLGEPGGASLYVALGAALWGTPTAIVAPVGEDYPRATLAALRERGIDLSGLRPLHRTGLRTWLRYEPAGRRLEHQPASPSHVEASPRPEDLSRAHGAARAFHIAPIPVVCQAQLIHALAARRGCHISIDPYDPFRAGTLAQWKPLLAEIDTLFVSEEEISLPRLDEDPASVLGALAGGRLRAIALKQGTRGGAWFDVAMRRAVRWPARAREVIDPTGAGDAFAGGVLSGVLAGVGTADALARGVVSASFALEGWGAAGLFAATAAQARERAVAWRGGFVE